MPQRRCFLTLSCALAARFSGGFGMAFTGAARDGAGGCGIGMGGMIASGGCCDGVGVTGFGVTGFGAIDGGDDGLDDGVGLAEVDGVGDGDDVEGGGVGGAEDDDGGGGGGGGGGSAKHPAPSDMTIGGPVLTSTAEPPSSRYVTLRPSTQFAVA